MQSHGVNYFPACLSFLDRVSHPRLVTLNFWPPYRHHLTGAGMFTDARDGPQGLMCASKHSSNWTVSPDLKKMSALLEAHTKTKPLYCCICEGWGQWSLICGFPFCGFSYLWPINEREHGRIYMYTVCYLEERDPMSTTLQFVCFSLVLCSVGEGAQGLVYGQQELTTEPHLPAHSFYYTILLQY